MCVYACAFIKDRLILDCSLLSYELVRDFNKPLGSRACVKIDLTKAFDSINREFVHYIMHCMGFPAKWTNWIKECIQRPMFSIMINGSSSSYFSSSRGIRQGDPISPYIMVMEFWTIHMNLAIASGALQPLKRDMHSWFHICYSQMICCNSVEQVRRASPLLIH